MMSFSDYLSKLGTALGEEDGTQLAFLLRPTSPHAKDLIRSLNNPTVRPLLMTVPGHSLTKY